MTRRKKFRYEWNEAAMNYCEIYADGRGFKEPLRPLKLSELAVENVPDILQGIWHKRYGEINGLIGISQIQDKEIAEKLEVW